MCKRACVCNSSQAAPPSQQTASACIINQDDWGGKHTERRSIPPLSVCLRFVHPHMCVYWCQTDRRTRSRKEIWSQSASEPDLMERVSCLSLSFPFCLSLSLCVCMCVEKADKSHLKLPLKMMWWKRGRERGGGYWNQPQFCALWTIQRNNQIHPSFYSSCSCFSFSPSLPGSV